jgi:hypothetical protein
MSSFVVRFPDGSKEFRFPEKMLEEGDVVWHEGQRYRVVHITTDSGSSSVTVELDSENLGDLLSSERGGIQLVPID